LVSSDSVLLALHRKCIGYFGFGLRLHFVHIWALQNALVFFGFVFFSQSCTSHGFWLCKSKRTMTSGTLTMLQKAVTSGTLTIFREGKKDLRTVFDLKGDTLFNFSSRKLAAILWEQDRPRG
jgi:hypothetical protein